MHVGIWAHYDNQRERTRNKWIEHRDQIAMASYYLGSIAVSRSIHFSCHAFLFPFFMINQIKTNGTMGNLDEIA